MKSCFYNNKITQTYLNALRKNNEHMNFHEQIFSEVSANLRELEDVEPQLLESIYNYKAFEKEQEEKNSQKVTKEFKQGFLDSSKILKKAEITKRKVARKNKFNSILWL